MKKTITEDDQKLWKHVTSSVKPYAPKKKPIKEARPLLKKKSAAGKPAAGTRAESAPSFGIRKTLAPSAAPAAAPKNAGFDKSTETKLKKGQLPLEGRIDLHGMTQDEAHRVLNGFITRAIKAGKRTLLVITGKGRVSTGGVLRRMVPLWLENHPGILAVTPAAIKDGGAGALYVRLRKPRT